MADAGLPLGHCTALDLTSVFGAASAYINIAASGAPFGSGAAAVEDLQHRYAI